MAWLITAAESEVTQRRAAAALQARGLGSGDRIVLSLPNSPDLLGAIIGAMRVGVVPVLLNPALTPAERDPLVTDADAAVVVQNPAELAALLDADPSAELAPMPLCRPMHYTSGTSGRPKGVWPGVLGEADARALHEDEAAVWGLERDDTHLTCSPLYHSVAVRFSCQALMRGSSVVLLARWDAHEAAAAIVEHRVRTTFMVPTHVHRLLSLPDLPDLSGLRRLVHAGAPCPHPLKQRLFDLLADGAVWEFYGATEGQFTICPPDEWLAHPGSVGRARPGRSLTVDDDGRIWCAVPEFARWSYWRDADKTTAAWRGDAFTVGDLGHLDGDGYLYLDGRRDDLIISGGVNVYPIEVEQALAAVPGVEEIAVFGVLDDQWGQRVCAAATGTATVEAIMAQARAALASYKRPKSVYLVGDLPRTATGKIRRTEIAAQLGLGSPG